jgi:hypothetical protein
MTQVEKFSLALAVIGCVAGVVVIPEVRCATGLDSPLECTEGLGATPLLPTLNGASPSPLARVQDPRVTSISTRFKWIEANQPGFLFQEVPLTWAGADSATATVYVDGGEIPKIRVRVYTGAERNSLLFYYTGSRLDFVHQVNKPSPDKRYEQRFYFHRNRLFRWLGPGNAVIAEGSAGFAENSAYLAQLGPRLLDLAHQALQRGT